MAFKPSLAQIKELRARSGAGLKDCKTALTDSEGDIEGAIDWLRKRGIAKAAKKAGRIAAEGLIASTITDDVGVIVEVNCETDFVARTDNFKDYVAETLDVLTAQKPASISELEKCTWSEGRSTEEMQQNLVLKTGENIRIRRFKLISKDEGSHLYTYIHTGALLGVLLKVKAPSVDGVEDKMEDIAMHMVSKKPEFLSSKDVPSEIIDKEFALQMERAEQDESLKSKPPKVLQGLIRGRVSKWTKEIAFLEQDWYEGSKVKVTTALKDFGTKFGGTVEVTDFALFALGEGIEKKENNFADEVASMTGQQ